MSQNENVYKLAYEAALAIAEAAKQEPEITFPINGFVVTGCKARWSQVVWSGHKPAEQENIRLWIRPKEKGKNPLVPVLTDLVRSQLALLAAIETLGAQAVSVPEDLLQPLKKAVEVLGAEAAKKAKAHVFRSTYGRPTHPGQDTIWVSCSCEWCPEGWDPYTRYSGDTGEVPFRTYHEVHGEWQAGHDRQYGIMEGDLLEDACPATRAFLAAIGYKKDYVAEGDIEGFLAFLDNLEVHVGPEGWEIEEDC